MDGLCPACGSDLTTRHGGGWCDRCHVKVETCCDGAPQAAAPPRPAGRTADPPGRRA